jgi:hypothetical protein
MALDNAIATDTTVGSGEACTGDAAATGAEYWARVTGSSGLAGAENQLGGYYEAACSHA